MSIGTSASDWYDRCNARPCNRKQIRSLLTIRPNSRAWQIWWLNGSVGRRRATVRQRTASIDHSILLSGVRSGVQCNAMTIDNALLGQNMVISMDSATKHFILTFYEMKNLENYRKSVLVELADRVHLGEHVLCRAVTDVKEELWFYEGERQRSWKTVLPSS